MPDINSSPLSGPLIPSLSPNNVRRRHNGNASEDGERKQFLPYSQGGEHFNADGTEDEIMAKTMAKGRRQLNQGMSFSAFRVNYLVVHIAIMLADGLQGTHLYVLYEGYGYSVPSLYCLGFLPGAMEGPLCRALEGALPRALEELLPWALEGP